MANSLITFILLITMIVSIILLYKVYTKKECTNQIRYKYIPRTFKEQQENPIAASDIFSDMFLKNSIHIIS